MRGIYCGVLWCALMVGRPLAVLQVAVPPPPKPVDGGPSLVDTMKFIEDKINQQDKVTFAAYSHDNISGEDVAEQYSYDARPVVADAASCKFTYHSTRVRNGVTKGGPGGNGFYAPLKSVQSIEVRTGEQEFKRINVALGHPSIDTKIDPQVYVLALRMPGSNDSTIFFAEEDVANRVAKALVHAVELCGGGNKYLF